MMLEIHDYLFSASPDLRSELREIGTQDYEADVVLLEQSGKVDHNPIYFTPSLRNQLKGRIGDVG